MNIAEMKLNPIGSILKDKIVVLVDDSIVRLTTAPKIVEMVRKAGAAEVHMVISSPPYRYPDFYGVDTPQQNKLAAFRRSLEEIRILTTADSLHYLSYEGLIRAVGIGEDQLCTSVFTGKYPIDLLERHGEVEIEA
jgi:amidophosphoribosyltransferase